MLRHGTPVHGHSFLASLENRTHAWLSEEEKIIHKQLLHVRSDMNEKLPIYRLPSELILEIFRYIHLSMFPSRKWILITHVSRRWRTIALACPVLWAQIGAFPGPLISECLRRNGDMPLTFEFERKGHYIGDISDLVKPHADRLTKVKLSLDSDALNSLAEDYIGFHHWSWDNLEAVSLHIRWEHDYAIIKLKQFFESPHPKLRYLSLKSVFTPDWKFIGSLQTLRILNLQDIYPKGERVDPQMNLDGLLDVLESCPLLEELDFVCALPAFTNPGTNTYPEPFRLVKMEHIRRVAITYPRALDVAYFLGHLWLPPTTHLWISNDVRTYEEIERSVLSCVPRHPHHLKPIDAVIYAHISCQSCISGESWPIITIADFTDGGLNENIPHVRLTQMYKGGDTGDFVRRLLRSLRWMFAGRPVRVVAFTFQCVEHELMGVGEDDWNEALSAFQSATGLCFNYDGFLQQSGSEPHRDRAIQHLRTFLQALTASPPLLYQPLPALTGIVFSTKYSSTLEVIREALFRCVSFRKKTSLIPELFQCSVIVVEQD